MSNQALVQVDMFSRGSAIKAELAKALCETPKYRTEGKGKNKKFKLTEKGEKIESSRTLTILPRKSEENPDLADLTGQTGQALMAFEMQARQAAMEAGAAHLMQLIASGNYTFDRARLGANGKFTFSIKLAPGRQAILSPEELERQAKALGFELVKTVPAKAPEPEPATSEPAGEATLDTSKKGRKAAKAAKTVTPPPIPAVVK